MHFMPHIQRTLVDCCADSHVLPSQCRSQRTHVVHVQMDKHFEAQWLTMRTAICTIMKLCILSHCLFMSVVLNRCRVRFCEVFLQGFEHDMNVWKVSSRTNILKTTMNWYRLIAPHTNACEVNPLTPNVPYSGRTAPLTSKRCILYIYSANIGTEYLKHGIYSPFLSLQNTVCFIIPTYLVPVLFTFYIQYVLK